MKREIIHIIEDGRVVIPAVHPDKIRMDEATCQLVQCGCTDFTSSEKKNI